MRVVSRATPDGNPSTMAVNAGPCDSPAVKYRSMRVDPRGGRGPLLQDIGGRDPLLQECVSGQAFVGLDILLAGPCHDLVGQRGGRAGLVPSRRLEPVADELLV